MGIIEKIKEIAKLTQDIQNVDLHKKILDLQGDVMDLEQEKRDLKEEVRNLTEKLNTKEAMVFKNNAYWIEKEGKASDDGPYCSGCFDGNHKPIRMHLEEPPDARCPVCNKQAQIDPDFKPPPINIPKRKRIQI